MELWETHCHTSEVSVCARSRAADMVEAYVQAGYDGMVITNHCEPRFTFQRCPDEDWDKRAEWYLEGYRAAARAAQGRCKVLWGIELRFTENVNDYLVYGLNEAILHELANAHFMEWGIEKFSRYAREHHLLLMMAHPFRHGITVIDPSLVDGVEVFNCSPTIDSHNFLAESWADRFGLLKSSGSDSHIVDYVAKGGILTEQPIVTIEDFCEAIRSRKIRLLS